MAVNCEDDNYTICLITHENFYNGFYSLLNATDYMKTNLNFGNENLLCLLLLLIRKKMLKLIFLILIVLNKYFFFFFFLIIDW